MTNRHQMLEEIPSRAPVVVLETEDRATLAGMSDAQLELVLRLMRGARELALDESEARAASRAEGTR